MGKIGLLFVLSLLVSINARAEELDVSDLDRAVRRPQTKSIMFMSEEESQDMLRQKAEQEAKQQAEKEAKLKQEQALFRPYNFFGKGYKIVAIINGEMISNRDLQERANLFSLTTGIRPEAKNKDMIANKVLQNTIDEKIKLQEAKKLGIGVSDKEVNEAYINFEKSNGVQRGKFANVLKEYQVSKDVFLAQVRANLLWNKLVARKTSGVIDVSARELEDEMGRIKKDLDTPKYMVSEIVIKKKNGEHIDELVEILQKDPRFELYAVQFSESASAPSGGKLGWIAKGQLATPLDNAIRNLKEGQVSKAIAYRTDYYIFKMEKIYNPNKEKQKMPKEDEVRNFIQNRKSEEIANKYIRDLRNRAVVEKRF